MSSGVKRRERGFYLIEPLPRVLHRDASTLLRKNSLRVGPRDDSECIDPSGRSRTSLPKVGTSEPHVPTLGILLSRRKVEKNIRVCYECLPRPWHEPGTSQIERHQLQPTVGQHHEFTSYEALPYPPYSFPATHIARLGAIGRVFSLATADPRQARVLELGCGSGINVLAMAQLYPGADFVGVDISAGHIQLADEARSATGLGNARFIQANIADLGGDLGQFDYIIAHGVYSWVPAEVREAILRLCHERLRPNGVAYLSYNCLPGWRMRGALRDMMRMHTRGLKDIGDKVAQSKVLLKFLAETGTEDTPHARYMRQELDALRHVDDAYIAHEFLEEENNAFYFTDFVEAAAAHQLAYLGEADPATMVMDNLPPPVAQALSSLSLDYLATEQHLDFLRNRAFRNTLLCHSSASLDRNINTATLRDLEVTALATLRRPSRNNEPAVFTVPNGKEILISDRHAADIMAHVATTGRPSRPFREVIEEVVGALGATSGESDASALREEVGRFLLQGYFRRLVDLTVGPIDGAAHSETEKPCVLPLARWQAAKGFRVSSHRLEMLQPDPFAAKLITVCDGTRDRAAIIDALTEAMKNGELQFQEHGQPIQDPERARSIIDKILDGSVEKLRRIGLLING